MWVEMGARPEDIAAALGTTVGYLRVRCSLARISLASQRPVVGGRLHPRVWVALQRAADRRGQTVPKLIADILAGVAERDLFALVLEDRPSA